MRIINKIIDMFVGHGYLSVLTIRRRLHIYNRAGVVCEEYTALSECYKCGSRLLQGAFPLDFQGMNTRETKQATEISNTITSWLKNKISKEELIVKISKIIKKGNFRGWSLEVSGFMDAVKVRELDEKYKENQKGK